MSVVVVIPTYNEKDNLPLLVDRLLNLPIQDLSVHVVDDNSPDGTGRVADELAARYPGRVSVNHRSGKLGLGSAYISSFKKVLQTDVEYIAHMDADFSHEPEKLVEFMAVIDQCDVVFGSRYIKGGSLDTSWPAWRKFLSGFGNTYARTILGLPVKDMTGGFRLWKREALASIPLDEIKSNGYIFIVEMAYLAHRLGFKIREIPIYFAERKLGKSKMNLGIQLEAAYRVWSLIPHYRSIKPVI